MAVGHLSSLRVIFLASQQLPNKGSNPNMFGIFTCFHMLILLRDHLLDSSKLNERCGSYCRILSLLIFLQDRLIKNKLRNDIEAIGICIASLLVTTF